MNKNQHLYSINVFAHQSLEELSPEKLKADLLKANFKTLCQQYGLKDCLIEKTRQNLEILFPDFQIPQYFIVKYQPGGGRPIIVRYRPYSEDERKIMLKVMRRSASNERIREQMASCKSIFSIDLYSSQLRDMGLLLGYEIARWIGYYGDGLMQDLHGEWYVLNQHQAFIPIKKDKNPE